MFRGLCCLLALAVLVAGKTTHADLLGYWSADSTNGQGDDLPNDQGNSDLDGMLINSEYSASGSGHTGQPGDFAISFAGVEDDYAELPPTDVAFQEITITAWVNGSQAGPWAGIVLSRDPSQPIGLDYHNFDGQVNYIWNDDSSQTWGFGSELDIPDEEWTFVALTITEDQAGLYAGIQGGTLDMAFNEIPHFEQVNATEWRLADDPSVGGQARGRHFEGLIDDVSIWDEALSDDDLARLHSGAVTPLTLARGGAAGDFNNDTVLDAADIDLLSAEVRENRNQPLFDLDGDGNVNHEDRRIWVEEIKFTWFGDANLDGQFNSSDFVAVFQIGEYEDGVDGNSNWADGDWNGDGNFNSGDFVTAFQSGGFEMGKRQQAANVPEPSGVVMLFVGLVLVGSGALRSIHSQSEAVCPRKQLISGFSALSRVGSIVQSPGAEWSSSKTRRHDDDAVLSLSERFVNVFSKASCRHG